MSKKLFAIAAFSIALLASAEAFAENWNYGVLKFKDDNRDWESIRVAQQEDWHSTLIDKQWPFADTSLSSALNMIGDEGWDLVSVTVSGGYTKMYFKKPDSEIVRHQ